MPFLTDKQSQRLNEDSDKIEELHHSNLYEGDNQHFSSTPVKSLSESGGFHDSVRESLLPATFPAKDEEFEGSSDSSFHPRDDYGSDGAAQSNKVPLNDAAMRSEDLVRICDMNIFSPLILLPHLSHVSYLTGSLYV